jgi:hypothetical protein
MADETNPNGARPDGTKPDDERDPDAYPNPRAREAWLVRRRRKIQEEIERNRRGEYKVPTWVLVALLVAIVTAWVLLVVLA